MSEKSSILVVDDDPKIRKLLRRYLSGEGFAVTEADGGEAMREALAVERFDLILLDLVMPGEDGLALMRELRRTSPIPVIMITGKGELIDRVVGLETGADDYIAKPFHLREVLARVRSVLRRTGEPAPAAPAAESTHQADSDCLVFDGWRIDVGARVLTKPSGATVELTTAEFNLLEIFARSPNRPLDRDQLMDRLKGQDWSPLDRSIDTQVGRLRKKIEADPAHPSLIKTVRGIGYLFTPKVAAG